MDKEFEVWFEENKKWLYSMDTMQAAWYVWSKSREAVQHNVQATGVDASHTCPIHPIVFDVDGCFMCNPRA